MTLGENVSKLEHRLITLHTPLTPHGRSTLSMLQPDAEATAMGWRLEHVVLCAYPEARGLQWCSLFQNR